MAIDNNAVVTNAQLARYDAGIKDIIAIRTAEKNPVRYKLAKTTSTGSSTYSFYKKDENDTQFVIDSTSDAITVQDSIDSTSSDPVSGIAVASEFTSQMTTQNINSIIGYTPMDSSLKGANSGVAELDGLGQVPVSQLPVASTYSATGTKPVNGTAVAAALATLPEPMVFIGTVGTGGTVTSLPSAASSNKGHTYKAISDGIVTGSKVGDTFISTGSEWVTIPSGDEPSGTVTQVGINASSGSHLSASGTVTSSGNLSIGVESGYQIPTSSDVSQISTNQSNILYALETGANNLCPESQLTIVGNSRTKSLTVNLPAGKYYISCNATVTNVLADAVFKNSAGTAIGTVSGFANGANVKSVTIADTATEFYFYSTDTNASFNNLMIVPEVVWNAIDHNFRTAAISNADLTTLEAEDRAGLIECVDKGAKNLINIADVTTTGAGYVINTYIKPLLADSYVFSYTSNQEEAGNLQLVVRNGDAVLADPTIVSKSGRNIIPFTISSTASRIELYTVMAGTYSDFMLCTKAEYDISPNYVPLALSNPILTPALIECVDNGAKNLWDFANANITAGGGADRITYIKTADSITLTAVSTWAFVSYDIALKKGTYYFYGLISGLTGTDSKCVQIRINGYQGTVIKRIDITASGAISDSFVVDTDRTITISLYVSEGEYTSSAFTISNLMICTEADWNVSHKYVSYAKSNKELTDTTTIQNDALVGLKNQISEIEQVMTATIYGYHVNPNESDPAAAVTYLKDAVGMAPAAMGATTFSYGSWDEAFFLPKPCVLKFDGTVDYYLDPNDYSKKIDGTAATIGASNTTGNVMLEFPKIWVKRVAGPADGERSVYISNKNVDGTYKCFSNINADNEEIPYFYLPAYNGTVHSNKMRSLSGVTLNSTYAPNYNRSGEITAATANNPSGEHLWYTEVWADFCLVYDLLYLMGKSLDVQRTFGQGLTTGHEEAMRAYVTGSLNDKGLFYGDISGTSSGVKVLGMENLWGCRWHAVAGLINDNGSLKVKMTYGTYDGSTATGYNITGDGYLDFGSTYGTNGYIKKMQADNVMGYKAIEAEGSDSTYYCDYYYTNNAQLNYGLIGGDSGSGAGCGFYVSVGYASSHVSWLVGCSLSCKPKAC